MLTLYHAPMSRSTTVTAVQYSCKTLFFVVEGQEN